MNRCLICFGGVEESINSNPICNNCLKQFEIIEKTFYYEGIEILILYKYNDYFRKLLYRYKGCYDYALKDAFLVGFSNKLKRKYRKRKIICAPSFVGDDKKRGFNHVKEIGKTLNFEMLDCVYKSSNYKQSENKMWNRDQIHKYIKIDKNLIKEEDRVLILDDVATSLSTIKAIIHLLPTNIDKKVLILASNCRFMKNEMI